MPKVCPTAIETWKEVKCSDNARQLMCTGLGERERGRVDLENGSRVRTTALQQSLRPRGLTHPPTHTHLHIHTHAYTRDQSEYIYSSRAALSRHIMVMV